MDAGPPVLEDLGSGGRVVLMLVLRVVVKGTVRGERRQAHGVHEAEDKNHSRED